MSKTLTTISLFIFWAIVTAVLVAGLVFNQNQSSNLPNSQQNQAVLGQNAGKVLTMGELAKHSTIDSCWLLISGKVYDVTSYLSMHPGGASTITPSCGKDATAAYNTKDPYATSASSGRGHSSSAKNLLANYYIGDLGQPVATTSATSTQNKNQQPPTTIPQKINTNQPTSTTNIIPTGQVTLNMQEIAKHNSAGDCWMLISGKVYNITNYFGSHPGGSSAMLPSCGKDATAAYNTKDPYATSSGGGSAHSSGAQSLLQNYFIGNLNQTIGQQTIQQTNTTPPPAQGGRGEYDD